MYRYACTIQETWVAAGVWNASNHIVGKKESGRRYQHWSLEKKLLRHVFWLIIIELLIFAGTRCGWHRLHSRLNACSYFQLTTISDLGFHKWKSHSNLSATKPSTWCTWPMITKALSIYPQDVEPDRLSETYRDRHTWKESFTLIATPVKKNSRCLCWPILGGSTRNALWMRDVWIRYRST